MVLSFLGNERSTVISFFPFCFLTEKICSVLRVLHVISTVVINILNAIRSQVASLVMEETLLRDTDPNCSCLYDIYKRCWKQDPEDRPSISVLLGALSAR